MPQAMAARTIRKHTAAIAVFTGLPPTTASESPPAVCVLGPLARETMPIANSEGSPAPAIRPNTRIFQIAEKLTQAFMSAPCRSGCCRGLGFGRGDRSAPLGVDVVVVHLAAAGPPVD